MRCQSFFRLAVASCVLFAIDACLYAQSRVRTQTHVRSQDPDASRLDELIAQTGIWSYSGTFLRLNYRHQTALTGIVADRTHNVAHAIALLAQALADLKAHSGDRAALALRALASDYFEAGRYGDSAKCIRRITLELSQPIPCRGPSGIFRQSPHVGNAVRRTSTGRRRSNRFYRCYSS